LRLMTPITLLLASTTGRPETLLRRGMMSSNLSVVLAVKTVSALRMRPAGTTVRSQQANHAKCQFTLFLLGKCWVKATQDTSFD
jgi:hypothetical protein